MAHARKIVPAAAGAAVAAAAATQVRRTRRRRSKLFRLGQDEPAADGLRRIAAARLEQIEHDPGDVHEVRKALKRLRALVRLAREELGSGVRRNENVAFRDAGRLLADARDAEVLLETFEGLVEDGAFPGLRHELQALATRAAARDRSEDTAAIAETAARARERIESWPLSDERAPLKRGYKRISRRARRAYKAAAAEPEDARLHELRKRTKDLRHAAELLGRDKTARRAHKLGDRLGDDRDLANLLDVSRRYPAALTPPDRELFERILQRRREALQRDALERSRRLF